MAGARHYALLLPGLGDDSSVVQSLAPRLWRAFGIQGQYMPMHWSSEESFATKLQRTLDSVDRLAVAGHTVSLVGISAGASMAMAVYAARPEAVSSVVCICGKINNPQTVAPWRYQQNPAFRESLLAAAAALPKLGKPLRSRILSLHSLHDGLVPLADSTVDDAVHKTIPIIGHVLSILWALTLGLGTTVRFLKRQAKAKPSLHAQRS